MPIATDMSQYLDVFLDEGHEQLALLESSVLEMERGNHTPEMLQALFRAAHTLKGSSRAMGFLAIGDLTHEMENILDDLRLDRISVTTPIVNALLECLDMLTRMVEAVSAEGTDAEAGRDAPSLVARLNALRNGPSPEEQDAVSSAPALASDAPFPVPDHVRESIAAALASGLAPYQITVTLDPECLMKSVRAWMVLGALEPLGTVLAANPDEDVLEAEEFDRTFSLLFVGEAGREAVKAALAGISEVETVAVELWAEPPVPAAEVLMLSGEASGSKEKAAPAPAQSQVTQSQVTQSQVTQSQTIRVEVSRLDSLLNLVGELVIERAQIRRIGADLTRRYPRDEETQHLLEATHHLGRITGELQDQIMKARMLPVDGVFQRMPRMVRDLAQKTGKEVDFRLSGGETELDRTVLEALGDPLIHLLRNSVDHGIETPAEREAAGKPGVGIVTLSARHEENHIVLDITDDGKGIDPNRLREAAVAKGLLSEPAAQALTDRDAMGLIFASGFSTAKALSDISGRGVGMDIVKSNLEKLGGRVLVESVVGQGSRFTIHLPLTLAIVRAILVEAGGGTYVLPLGSVVEMLRLGTGAGDVARQTLGGQAVFSLRGRTIPLASLSGLLCGDPCATRPDRVGPEDFVVVVGLGESQVGLCVDALVGEQEVVIKSLGTMLGDIPGLAGATILGDGRVALIVDVAKAVEKTRREEPNAASH